MKIFARMLEMYVLTIVTVVVLVSARLDRFGEECTLREKTNFTGVCNCTSLLDIRCSGLDSIPELVSPNSTVYNGIYMASQSISIAQQGIFSSFPVHKIVLNFNPIGNSISGDVLLGLGSVLRELQLGDCQLQNVPVGMLNGMEELRHLHMWGNKIKKLPPGFFKSCTNLRELLLWGNQLEEINDNTFAGLWGLRKLDLDKNKISLLHKDAFRHLSNLEVIHLGENEIKTISSETFLFVGNLKVLNLDGNRIEHVYGKAFDGLINLVTLALDHNNISFLPGEAFTNLRNLTTILLHKNQLEAVWPKTFAGQKSLYLLNLSDNRLASLPDGILKQNHRLRSFYADNNKLQTVQRCILSNRRLAQASLRTLSLLGNQIQCDCRLTWLVEIHESKGVAVWGVCNQTNIITSPTSLINRTNYGSCSFAHTECKQLA